MNRKLHALTQRREHLIAQIADQRGMLAQSITPFRGPLALIDKGLILLSYVRRHPVWIIGAGMALITPKSAFLGKWLGRIWVVWKMTRRLRG